MTILKLNDLALELVARDFSDGHNPSNGGPTKTSRALAIIHLAAHDAYAEVTGLFPSKLATVPKPPAGLSNDDVTGTVALMSAGIRAAQVLYPDDADFIVAQAPPLPTGIFPQRVDLWPASGGCVVSCSHQ